MAIIEAHNVTKTYQARSMSLALQAKRGLGRLFGRQAIAHEFHALKGVSFEIEAGQSVGIIGANGSGKSTLLKILSGVTVPTSGHVVTRGRVASLLELGAGFHPLLTGRENIYLNAGILGMRHAQVNEVIDRIIDFSGIGEFIDNPVDTYSSGMYVRIGFSVAVHTNPDIFLVDEVLAVGDEAFQRKCRAKIGELKAMGKTIVFVSHDLSIVNTLCDRVVLLSRGEMIVRRTPQETINYYLRMVGQDKGIHTFQDGRVEVIASHGHISLFREGREMTASRGIVVTLRYMGQIHWSTDAEWEVVERRKDGCVARGRMPRLPVTLVWELAIKDEVLQWGLAIECEHELDLQAVCMEAPWPTRYTRLVYGDVQDVFPEILPDDTHWTPAVQMVLGCQRTAVLPDENDPVAPAVITVNSRRPGLSFQWMNSEYTTASRILRLDAPFPEADWPLVAGRHEIGVFAMDLSLSAEEACACMAELGQDAALRSGSLTARFQAGVVRLYWDDVELTRHLGLYASLLAGNIWADSTAMNWQAPRRDGDRITVEGASRRFSYRLIWEMSGVPAGFDLKIFLEADDPFDVQEYQVSLCLREEYSFWKTEYESGQYPPFDPDNPDWKHVNRDYTRGKYMSASGGGLPGIVLAIMSDDIGFSTTAINTGFHEKAHVLQALRTGIGRQLHFEKGRHLYFAGRVTVDRDQT